MIGNNKNTIDSKTTNSIKYMVSCFTCKTTDETGCFGCRTNDKWEPNKNEISRIGLIKWSKLFIG